MVECTAFIWELLSFSTFLLKWATSWEDINALPHHPIFILSLSLYVSVYMCVCLYVCVCVCVLWVCVCKIEIPTVWLMLARDHCQLSMVPVEPLSYSLLILTRLWAGTCCCWRPKVEPAFDELKVYWPGTLISSL